MVKSGSSGGGGIDWGQTAIMLGETVIFALAMVYAVRPLLRQWVVRAMNNPERELSLFDIAI